MKKLLLISITFITLFTFSCSKKSTTKLAEVNPAALGFDYNGSDKKAMQIADKVMFAMGGRESYDDTRYLFWNFFGSRTLLWDKHKGDVRIESQKDDFTVVMNIHSLKGKVKMNGEELTNPDSLSKYLQRGKNIWINDSYWLVMPFKLKDSGVTLTYAGEEEVDGKVNDILELRFKNVGKTPENKYQVFVDRSNNLVSKWAFYPKAEDAEPRFTTPWDGYVKHGKILLGSGRGKYELTDIKVMEKVEKGIFEEF